MICELCHGTGHKQVNRSPWVNAIYAIPCPRCGGCGITSCCEGGIPCDNTLRNGRIKQPDGCANTASGLTESNLSGGPNGSEAVTKR